LATSEAAELGDRLCFSLPMMTDFGTPIYSSESMKLLRYSRKLKGAKMNENLIAKVVEAINVPRSSLGPCSSLALAPFRDEVYKPLLQRGFLLSSSVIIPSTKVGGSSLPSSQSVGEKMLGVGAPSRLVVSSMFGCSLLLSSSSEVGESSRGGDLEGVTDFCFQTLGVSYEEIAMGF
jgi:hypothetical protein